MISGVVVDPLRRPVEGAEVRIAKTSLSTLTLTNGSFRLTASTGDPVLVLVRRPGYKGQLLSIRAPWTGTVQLSPGVFELPEVQVTARYAKPSDYAGTTRYDDFFRRRRLGLGQFIDRAEIDRRSPTRAVEILQGRAGIRVDLRPVGASGGTIVAFSRCNEFPPKINVYVDGRRQMPEGSVLRMAEGAPAAPRGRTGSGETDAVEAARREARAMVGSMLDRIPIGDIELIEVFRGPGELPPEFNEGNCGAISVWTRQAR
ncbi:MAG TPA: carboxypeptidase regulatory-like domain-containing protein [Gemmatimonadales bacterium]|nr:carboxypeptidase regulatory-like domain-containing protein [Gemmatimonadales bacterium]